MATMQIPVQTVIKPATRLLIASSDVFSVHEVINGNSTAYEVLCHLKPEQAATMNVGCSNLNGGCSCVHMQDKVHLVCKVL